MVSHDKAPHNKLILMNAKRDVILCVQASDDC